MEAQPGTENPGRPPFPAGSAPGAGLATMELEVPEVRGAAVAARAAFPPGPEVGAVFG